MKFMKGVMIGTMVTAGAMMMYSDTIDANKKKWMKKSKKIFKQIGW